MFKHEFEAIFATFIALLSVVNPFGATPVFLALTEGYDKLTKRNQALRTAVYMSVVLIIFFFAGKFILIFFNLRVEDLRIAGGLLIASSGFRLMAPGSDKKKAISKDVEEEGMEKADISFTPMAMPLLSGPGAIAVTIGMNASADRYSEYIYTVVSILLVSLLTYLLLRSSYTFTRFLGKGGMAAVTKMMGFFSLSIGVSFIVNGILALAKHF